MKNYDIFLIFAQNIDCGYSLEPPRVIEAVLTSTHNLCFRAKIRKNEYPCKPQFYYITRKDMTHSVISIDSIILNSMSTDSSAVKVLDS